MAKKGVKSIQGPSSPKIGQLVSYSVSEFYPGTPEDMKAKVKWKLFKKRADGTYTATNIIKDGLTVTYTFGEPAPNIDFKVVAFIFTPELTGTSIINVKPSYGPATITGISILDYQGKKITKTPKYGQIVTISVDTVNMLGEDLSISLWERDTISDTGHDKKENVKLWERKKTVENKNGNVKIQKRLTLDMATASAKSLFEGDMHEYYAVVEAKRLSNSSYSKNQVDILADTSNYEVNYKLQDVLNAQGIDVKPPLQNGDSSQTVGEEVKTDTNVCPRCKNEITFEEINKICVNTNGKSLIVNADKIKAALPHLNKYRDKVGLNTCTKKAHFLAQLSQESKFYDLAEGFNYYWEALVSTFSAFQTAEGKKNAKLWGRSVKTKGQPNYASVTPNNQISIASWAYKSKNENGGFDTKDGWKYRGRGFKQITWKSNYRTLSEYFNSTLKLEGDSKVDWVAHPESLTENGKDAILSALAYWAKNGINAVATGSNGDDVTNVTRKINPALKGLDERKRFFNNAVKVLKVNECNPGTTVINEEGTVVLISGQGAKMIGSSVVYETSVYKNITLKTFKDLHKNNKLPKSDHTTYFARDAHGEKYGTHSSKRYGKYNECPPGEYYLIPKTPGQLYKIYVSDDGKSPFINGVHGQRGGIALHQFRPFFAIGCLTSCTGKDLTVVNSLLKALDNLPKNAKKPVRVIIEDRKVKETKWPKTSIGTTKWTGIL